MLTIKLFNQEAEILKQYQDKFNISMLTNIRIQMMHNTHWLICWQKGYQNLCVVGDADQSIYGWRVPIWTTS